MHPPQFRLGCFGLVAIALFLGTFVWIFMRISDSDHAPEMKTDRHHHGEEIGSAFTTMDAQLIRAKEKGQKVTSIYLEGSPAPLMGQWSIQEAGYDVVVLDGPSGIFTFKIEVIAGLQVERAKKSVQLPVEK